MKQAITTALLLAGAASLANAQASVITFEATVVEISDSAGHFDSILVGDSATGSFTLDFTAPNNSGDNDFPLGSFDALGLEVSVNGMDFVGLSGDDAPYSGEAILGDNILRGSLPDDADIDDIEAALVDWLNLEFALSDISENLWAGIQADFEGASYWFEGIETIPNPSTMGLENLISAEVVIEFLSWDEGYSRMRIEMNSLSSELGTIATIGCQSYRFAAPVAQFDFFDISGFLQSYQASEATADLNGDGSLDFFDISEFITQARGGCSN